MLYNIIYQKLHSICDQPASELEEYWRNITGNSYSEVNRNAKINI